MLVVPDAAITRVGPFEGFIAERRYFATLAEARFLDRTAAEDDATFRQIIPYLVLRGSDGLFSYARTPRGAEGRLHGLRSIGVGGHVNPDDLTGGPEGLAQAPEAGLIHAARRELAEETRGLTDVPLTWLGFIRDNSAAVARVHLGVVFVVDLTNQSARLSDEGKMTDARFDPLPELTRSRAQYEGWSRLVIEHLDQR